MGNFSFLNERWPDVWHAASAAEASVPVDPRSACFYSRRALELAVRWVYIADRDVKLPYQDDLNALLHEPTFKELVGDAVLAKAQVIQRLGQRATHGSGRIKESDAIRSLREFFHVAVWLGHTYGALEAEDEPRFDVALLSTPLEKEAEPQPTDLEMRERLASQDEPLRELLRGDEDALDDALRQLRIEVAAAKRAALARPTDHDFSEEETRDYFIDLLLAEAGWMLLDPQDREYEVEGMPNEQGIGYVDYVLWGDDGLPLALVEAKRTKKSAAIGQQQAKLYANCLEARFGRRPVIFYSNGYHHWLWDDAMYPPRPVQGFLTKDDLELMVQRRTVRSPLVSQTINSNIVERYYQTRAIRRVTESFEAARERKALLVMATGAGKTRTVIALSDLLMRANWVKRVLFLADRVALVKQAVGAFKTHLPESSPVNLVTEKDAEGRVYVSTYQSMMQLIEEMMDGRKRFGVGYFDLVIIDEAHRSVYQKYRSIFEYFDSLLIGLTATPKDEIDVNTYGLFDLERGVPTDAYALSDAVKDGFLVPAKSVSVPLKFPRQGIKYEDLSEAEREQWDALEWDKDGGVPDEVEAQAINRWLFNKDTVDKALQTLMTRGQTVAGGDRIGKTIIFAKSQAHAEFIAERFDVNYPQFKGEFARVIHHGVPYAQTLIDDFSNPEKSPHIAISVDMLDTGIDVPEVVNLVFFKLVRSKTKFWQMVGRGTRLRPDLFGPGVDKEFFYIFDFCENLEFFSQSPEVTEGTLGESLSRRLFAKRLELLGQLDSEPSVSHSPGDLRHDVAKLLQGEVAAMNVDNFVVRPHRELVERYAQPDAWLALSAEQRELLAHDVGGLPTELEVESEEAKRFDLLMLNVQLAMLRADPMFVKLRKQVETIAGLLEEKAAIPMVAEQMELIQDMQTDEWWQDVTLGLVENARKRLRALVRLIDKRRRRPVYADFEDLIGDETEIQLPDFATAESFTRFRAKVQAFLTAQFDHVAIQKLRRNRALTQSDLLELERMLTESGVASPQDLERAVERSNGLGLFVRSLVGLDREAAKDAFAGFLEGGTFSANQIEFVNMVIDRLTLHGVMGASALYESPFTDLAPKGPDELFSNDDVTNIVAILDRVRLAAESPGDAAASV